jgi:recombination protein RecT
MTKAEVESHACRYSQAYKAKGKSSFKSPWETDFDLMAQKTALKLLLSKFAPLSTEMQEAIAVDQSVDNGNGRSYIDNDELNHVNADDDKKAAIIAANSTPPANVDPETGEIKDEEAAAEPPTPPKPAEPKESVAEKAKRKYGPKQETLVDDKDS